VEGFWNQKSISCAAPQVGHHQRLFVMCDRAYWYHPKYMYKKFLTVINPEVMDYSKELCLAWEGCISNDENIALVERPKQVKVKYWNL